MLIASSHVVLLDHSTLGGLCEIGVAFVRSLILSSPADQCRIESGAMSARMVDGQISDFTTSRMVRDLSAAPADGLQRRMRGKLSDLQARTALDVVVYHHVAPRADAFTDKLLVTTSPDNFRAHLQFYRKHYDLISPSDLERGKLPARPLLITFDDAYRSVCEVAAPILRDAGAEALFFINPAAALDQHLPTDNLVCLAATVLGEAEVSRIVGCQGQATLAFPHLLMTVIARLSASDLERTRQMLLQRLGYTEAELHARAGLFMTPAHLANLSNYGLHAGNHTMTHRMLRVLSSAELDDEICGAKYRIEQATGQVVKWCSLPYGGEKDATPQVLSLIAASGHLGTFLVQGRLNRLRPRSNVLYRVSPRDIRPSLLPVSLRLLPALRTLRHAVRSRGA